MALKWPNNTIDNGILRKNDVFENKDDLLVFGYSCKLFRDDEKALFIDQGKHLIPWMGDETLKIDRYDCRGNMGARELAAAESRLDSGNSWLQLLSPEEQRAERLCDEERYRALHTDEYEEQMYREEELKRLHMMARGSSYGQVQFNYDGEGGQEQTAKEEQKDGIKTEEDEPFVPSPLLSIPEGMPLPDTMKLNAIIEKTAIFIASQGTQMEILLKAKQAGNLQFEFLSLECPLHPYYSHLLAAIREGRYRPDQQDKQPEKVEEEDHYLHPSLAPVSVESAPSIPSIAYKPSADCAYSMLVNQIKGKETKETQPLNDVDSESDIAPPGTEILPLPIPKRPPETNTFSKMNAEQLKKYASHPFSVYHEAEISKAPVLYGKSSLKDNANTATMQNVSLVVSENDKNSDKTGLFVNNPKPENKQKSVGLKLIHYSDSESDDDAGNAHKSSIPQPPPDQQVIIDKMASYVAKNGDTFEQIVKMKGDPRFYFLNPEHKFYSYYKHKRTFYEQMNKKAEETNDNESEQKIEDNEEKNRDESETKAKAPVSFSIKKIKEAEPILPKPALPYESSSEEEETNEEEKDKGDKNSVDINEHKKEETVVQPQHKPSLSHQQKPSVNQPQQKPSVIQPQQKPSAIQPQQKPSIIQPQQKLNSEKSTHVAAEKPEPIIIPKPIVLPKPIIIPKPVPPPKFDLLTIYHIQADAQQIEKRPEKKEKTPAPLVRSHRSHHKSRSKDRKAILERSPKTEESDDGSGKERRRKRGKSSKSEKKRREPDVITIEEENPMDPSDFIDLTEDYKDDKYSSRRDKNESYDEPEKNKIQVERKKRAAAFLSSLKDLPTLASQQQTTLASAMVKTLNSYQSSRDVEDSKYRRRRRDESNNKRKSKKRRRNSRDRSYSQDSEDDVRLEKSSRSSRHHKNKHHKSKKSSHEDRYSQSKSRKEETKKSSRYECEMPPKEKSSTKEQIKIPSVPIEYPIIRKQDKLLTTSLKELVREARKDLIAREPIKMAVDIFSNDSCSPVSYKNVKMAPGDEWERDSSDGGDNDRRSVNESKDSSESGQLTSQSDDD